MSVLDHEGGGAKTTTAAVQDVGYAQDNSLKDHIAGNLEAERHHLLDWKETVADTRDHDTTKKRVGKVFCKIERPTLRPPPREWCPCFHENPRTISRDGLLDEVLGDGDLDEVQRRRRPRRGSSPPRRSTRPATWITAAAEGLTKRNPYPAY